MIEKKLQNFEITKTIHSNSERSEQCLNRIPTLEQIIWTLIDKKWFFYPVADFSGLKSPQMTFNSFISGLYESL